MSPIALTKNLGSAMLLVAFALCILIDVNPGVEAKSFAAGAETLVRGRCEVGCTNIYEPLCGTDGKTYPNRCTLYVENNCDRTSPDRILKAYDGECKANASYPDRATCIKEALENCIGLQVIICGTDGNVYGDTCDLMAKNKCDGTSVRMFKEYDGGCKAIAEYPDRATCIKEASKGICTQTIICGTDGIVYGNPCQLKAKNVCDGTSVGVVPASHCQQ